MMPLTVHASEADARRLAVASAGRGGPQAACCSALLGFAVPTVALHTFALGSLLFTALFCSVRGGLILPPGGCEDAHAVAASSAVCAGFLACLS